MTVRLRPLALRVCSSTVERVAFNLVVAGSTPVTLTFGHGTSWPLVAVCKTVGSRFDPCRALFVFFFSVLHHVGGSSSSSSSSSRSNSMTLLTVRVAGGTDAAAGLLTARAAGWTDAAAGLLTAEALACLVRPPVALAGRRFLGWRLPEPPPPPELRALSAHAAATAPQRSGRIGTLIPGIRNDCSSAAVTGRKSHGCWQCVHAGRRCASWPFENSRQYAWVIDPVSQPQLHTTAAPSWARSTTAFSANVGGPVMGLLQTAHDMLAVVFDGFD